MNRMTGIHFCRARLACLAAAVLVWGTMEAAGQTLAPARPAPVRGAQEGAGALPAATTYNPDRVRNHLKAIHGFTRAQLDAASTDVPLILMAWIADPDEQMLVRRQAIKALKLYPSEETLSFIRDALPGAPAPLQMLFLGTLKAHVQTHPAEVAALAGSYLDHGQVTVRHAAVSLVGALQAGPELTHKLRARLAQEPDPAVRTAIRQALKPH